MLASLDSQRRREVIDHTTLNSNSVFVAEVTAIAFAVGAWETQEAKAWRTAYEQSIWFGEIYKFLTKQKYSPERLRDTVWNYETTEDILWIHRLGCFLPCVPEAKVRNVLKEVHDDDGHWAKTGTIARLRGLCY